MPISIVVPQLGESVAEGTVSKWLKAEGERVRKGQPLVVVEAMKMEHTLKAPRDGAILRLVAREGELIEAGAALMEVE